jgi:hypothetical protein
VDAHEFDGVNAGAPQRNNESDAHVYEVQAYRSTTPTPKMTDQG